MAFLLLLHQKMKLQRKENQLTLKQLRFSSRVDRMQKKVDKRQKYYDKLRKQIERQANCYKNSMNMQISNMYGLGTNSVNLGNMFASNGATQLMLQQMLSNSEFTKNFDKNLVKAMQSGANLFIATSAIKKDDKNYANLKLDRDVAAGELVDATSNKVYGEDIARQFQQLQNNASAQVTQMQTQASQVKACYENNVSIWQEAALEELEAQEEWEMDMLAEEQADMEAEKNSVEVQLQRVQEEKKNIEQALGQAIQDSAPKFGLA